MNRAALVAAVPRTGTAAGHGCTTRKGATEMITEITDNELRALQGTLSSEGIHTVRFDSQPTGLAVKVNEQGWEPLGTVVKADESQRFQYVAGAKVHASFYDRAGDRFVILAERTGAVDPWVVAYVRTLTDSEWESGRYTEKYDDAVTNYMSRVIAASRV